MLNLLERHKAILRWIEVNHSNHSAREPVDLSVERIEVEHIMPQTLSPQWQTDLGADFAAIQDKWLHTPGNLTLTGYNREFGNRPFCQKRDGEWTTSHGQRVLGYKGSNIALTLEIASFDLWAQTEIEGRGYRMADSAVQLWTRPEINA